MTCVYCPLPIKDTDVYWMLKCKKHLAHATHGTSRCTVCAQGSVSVEASASVPVSQQSSNDQQYHDSRARRLANNAARSKEPLVPYDPSPVQGWFAGVLRVAGRLGEANIPDEESEDPVALLDAKVPLQTIRQKHGFDITELIKDYGVTIADFFRNGYTMGEMCDAFHSRMNPQEGMRVLYCLGMTDEYISARAEQSQVPIMKERLGFNVESLLRDLEYKFVPGRWTLPQMLEVGLTMPVVMKAGLSTVSEWMQLANTAQTEEDYMAFGVTPELELSLTDDRPQAVAPPPPAQTTPSTVTTGSVDPVLLKVMNVVAASAATTPAKKQVASSWSSPLPAEVMAARAPAKAVNLSSIQKPLASAPIPIAKSVPIATAPPPPALDNFVFPPLVIPPQHQAAHRPKYALK
jgi:hypothetical protein